MSIIRPVIRMCAVAALRGRTYAEERVFDSDNTPLADAILNGPAKPYVTVFTDQDNRTQIDGKDVYTTQRQMNLILEMGIASAAEVENKGVVLRIPQTDPMLELMMDVMETQCLNAIFTDPDSQYGDFMRQMVMRAMRLTSIRGGSGSRGTRWAARQMVLQLDTLADLPPGYAPDADHPIRLFLDMAEADQALSEEMTPAVKLLRSMITAPGDATPHWKHVQGWLGLSRRAVREIGITPLLTTDEQVQTGDEEGDINVVFDDTLPLDPPPGDQRVDGID